MNIDTGYGDQNSTDQLLVVQTPATTFTVATNSVSACMQLCNYIVYDLYFLDIQITAYPGETMHIAVLPYDEQNYLTSQNFQIMDNDNNVGISKISKLLLYIVNLGCFTCI